MIKLVAACFACTALVIFSLSFRPPASLARPSFSFRSLFGRLLRLHGPRYLFALFSTACFACTALVFILLSFRPPVSTNCLLGSLGLCFLLVCSLLAGLGPLLAALGPLLGALGPLLAALGLLLGRSWALLGGSWGALGRSWGDLGTTCENHHKIDAKNDRFWLPKAPPNDTKIAIKSNQK